MGKPGGSGRSEHLREVDLAYLLALESYGKLVGEATVLGLGSERPDLDRARIRIDDPVDGDALSIV